MLGFVLKDVKSHRYVPFFLMKETIQYYVTLETGKGA